MKKLISLIIVCLLMFTACSLIPFVEDEDGGVTLELPFFGSIVITEPEDEALYVYSYEESLDDVPILDQSSGIPPSLSTSDQGTQFVNIEETILRYFAYEINDITVGLGTSVLDTLHIFDVLQLNLWHFMTRSELYRRFIAQNREVLTYVVSPAVLLEYSDILFQPVYQLAFDNYPGEGDRYLALLNRFGFYVQPFTLDETQETSILDTRVIISSLTPYIIDLFDLEVQLPFDLDFGMSHEEVTRIFDDKINYFKSNFGLEWEYTLPSGPSITRDAYGFWIHGRGASWSILSVDSNVRRQLEIQTITIHLTFFQDELVSIILSLALSTRGF